MGGSGGFFSGNINSSEIADKLKKAQDETEKQSYENEVDKEIKQFLSLTQKDASLVNSRVADILKALSSDIEGSIKSIFGGSVSKYTYIEGISDIDVLAVINTSGLQDQSPRNILNYFYDRLKARYPKTEINKGNLAVTLKFKDTEVQILPSIRNKTGVKVPDWTGNQWVFIKPQKFQKALKRVNDRNGGKVLSVIRLAKAIMAKLPEGRKLSGYHTEALSVEFFRHYQGDRTHKSMLHHFFSAASNRVLKALPDVTGQSQDISSYLGKANSLKRKLVANAMGQVARKIERADTAMSINIWKDLI